LLILPTKRRERQKKGNNHEENKTQPPHLGGVLQNTGERFKSGRKGDETRNKNLLVRKRGLIRGTHKNVKRKEELKKGGGADPSLGGKKKWISRGPLLAPCAAVGSRGGAKYPKYSRPNTQ